MIKLLLIDDHTLVRHGLRLLLNNSNEIQVVGEASTGAEGIQLTRELRPAIILLDIKLPDISGLEAMARLLRLNPAPKILILSSAGHSEFPRRFLEAGASGYITKEVDQEELLQAIKIVYKGQFFISTEIASRLAMSKINHQTSAHFSQLSQKEMEILLFSVRSVSPEMIAQRLHMSPKTVHGYRSRIFQKLGVDNDVKLMTLAIREGLLTIEDVDNP